MPTAQAEFGNCLFATLFLLLSLGLIKLLGFEFLSLDIRTVSPTPRPPSPDTWTLKNLAPASSVILGKLKFLCPCFLKF